MNYKKGIEQSKPKEIDINNKLSNLLSDEILNSNEAKQLTDIFEKNKSNIINVSKENLNSLRSAIGVSSYRNWITGTDKRIIRDIGNGTNDTLSYSSKENSQFGKLDKIYEGIGYTNNEYTKSNNLKKSKPDTNSNGNEDIDKSFVKVFGLDDEDVTISGLDDFGYIDESSIIKQNPNELETYIENEIKEISKSVNQNVSNILEKQNNILSYSKLKEQTRGISKDDMKRFQISLGIPRIEKGDSKYERSKKADGYFGKYTYGKYLEAKNVDLVKQTLSEYIKTNNISSINIDSPDTKNITKQKTNIAKLKDIQDNKEEKKIKNSIDKNDKYDQNDIISQAKSIDKEKIRKLQLILGFTKGNGVDGQFGNGTFKEYEKYNKNWKNEGLTEKFVDNVIEKNRNYLISNLLDIISKGEGTYGNYDAIFKNGKQSRIKYSQMTLNDILKKQKSMGRYNPIGKYQFIKSTLNELIVKENYNKYTQKFTPEFQDKIAILKLEKRGLDKYLSGRISKNAFQKNLSMEWASLPKDIGGKSYYDGDGINKSSKNKEVKYASISNKLSRFL